MKVVALIGAAALLSASAAVASDAAPRTTDKPAAVANPHDVNKTTAAPVAGKNSFSMSEAKKRLEANGYTGVSGLKKDAQQVWEGKATKDGQPVTVMLDYQGNITTK